MAVQRSAQNPKIFVSHFLLKNGHSVSAVQDQERTERGLLKCHSDGSWQMQ